MLHAMVCGVSPATGYVYGCFVKTRASLDRHGWQSILNGYSRKSAMPILSSFGSCFTKVALAKLMLFRATAGSRSGASLVVKKASERVITYGPALRTVWRH